MTLTKYQRGEPMEGWNDCPPMMLQNNSSSSINSKTRRRPGRPDYTAQGSSDYIQTRTVSLASLKSTTAASDNSNVSIEQTTSELEEEIDVNQVLDTLFGVRTSLSDALRDQIKTKISTNIVKSSNAHKAFLKSIVDQVKSGEDKQTLQQQIVDYMMANDGVSSWSSPLKKYVYCISNE